MGIGEIDFNDKSWRQDTITHSGDQLDEAKAHGSHEIRIQMKRLTEKHKDVYSLLFVLSAYSQDLRMAVKPFISLRDGDDTEVARFEPDANYNATSLMMVDLHRHREGWVLSAHGVLGMGRANKYGPIINVYKNILDQIVKQGDRKGLEIDYSKIGPGSGRPTKWLRGPAFD